MLCRAVLQNVAPVMHQNYLVNSQHITGLIFELVLDESFKRSMCVE